MAKEVDKTILELCDIAGFGKVQFQETIDVEDIENGIVTQLIRLCEEFGVMMDWKWSAEDFFQILNPHLPAGKKFKLVQEIWDDAKNHSRIVFEFNQQQYRLFVTREDYPSFESFVCKMCLLPGISKTLIDIDIAEDTYYSMLVDEKVAKAVIDHLQSISDKLGLRLFRDLSKEEYNQDILNPNRVVEPDPNIQKYDRKEHQIVQDDIADIEGLDKEFDHKVFIVPVISNYPWQGGARVLEYITNSGQVSNQAFADRIMPSSTAKQAIANFLKNDFLTDTEWALEKVAYQDSTPDKEGSNIRRYKVWIAVKNNDFVKNAKPLGMKLQWKNL